MPRKKQQSTKKLNNEVEDLLVANQSLKLMLDSLKIEVDRLNEENNNLRFQISTLKRRN